MTTELGLCLIILALIALEAWAVLNKKHGDTISEVTWRTSMRFPFIVFLFGFLCGHLFWQSERVYDQLIQQQNQELKR